MICLWTTLEHHPLYETMTGTKVNGKQRSKDYVWFNEMNGGMKIRSVEFISYLINPKISWGVSFPHIKEGIKTEWFFIFFSHFDFINTIFFTSCGPWVTGMFRDDSIFFLSHKWIVLKALCNRNECIYVL